MQYEVEQKYSVENFAAIERELADLDATWEPPRDQCDTYYAHPSRDFAQTDEALRIRRIGHETRITYKGPKIDDTTKTRVEIELPLTSDPQLSERYGELLEALSFRRVSEVRKTRRSATVEWQGHKVTVDLDEVGGLGCYVELEMVASADQLDAARLAIGSLAEQLKLGCSERRSYLELLLGE